MPGTKCTISLDSRQRMNGDTENTKEQYEGTFVERESKKYLSYKRKTEDGNVDCLISFNRRSITITQKGQLNSKLELIPGKKTINVYNTPMGALNLQVFTRRYEVIEQKDILKISIEYDIITGADAIQTSMNLEIKF